MDALTFLRERVALFAGIDDERLTPLAAASTLSTYQKGQTVLFKGATVDALHVVAVGRVAVFVKPLNQPLKQVAELASGDVFGETSILEMGTAGALIKALDDGTVVLDIPQDPFRALLKERPDFVARVQAMIAARKPA